MKVNKTILVLLFLVCVSCNTQKKSDKDIPRNLKIGDQVPNIKIAKILNDKVKKAEMFDYKDQLLILDFLNTG